MKTRKFKCIGVKETIHLFWNNNFIVGGVYKLKQEDTCDKTLELNTGQGYSLWVDADQFEEVK